MYFEQDGSIDIMQKEEFRKAGKEIIDYIVNYTENLKEQRVTPDVNPSFLLDALPKQAPNESEKWADIMKDMDTKIMPGVTHWIHPNFYAYSPSGRSFPSILGETLASAIGGEGFSWSASPAQTELEMVVLDWLGKAFGLPDEFLHSHQRKKGGGCFQPSGSDAVLVAMMAARHAAVTRTREERADYRWRTLQNRRMDEVDADCAALQKVVAYTSNEAHMWVEKAAKICLVQLHTVQADNENRMRGDALRRAMEHDERLGLRPSFVCATLGTPTTCSFDNLRDIAFECRRRPGVWLHVDAPYAGNALLCPELRHIADGIEHAHSISISADQWLPVNFDCSCLWVRDYMKLVETFAADSLHLEQEQDNPAVDFRHWGLPVTRRFRALKLWFTMRTFGINNLQERIREHCSLAKHFEDFLLRDKRFKVMNEVKLGVVCFRLESLNIRVKCNEDHLTELLLAFLNASGRTFFAPVEVDGVLTIRFCVGSSQTKEEDIENTWLLIVRSVDRIEDSVRGKTVVMTARPAEVREDQDQEQEVSLLRFLTGTVTAPPARYRRLTTAQVLRDTYGPYLVPDSDDRIAEIFDLSALAGAYWRT